LTFDTQRPEVAKGLVYLFPIVFGATNQSQSQDEAH
jgi:hypothetical protein